VELRKFGVKVDLR